MMACDLGKMLVDGGIDSDKADAIVQAFQSASPAISKIKKRNLGIAGENAGASIAAIFGDLSLENLGIGSMDIVNGDFAPKRAQAVAVASNGTSTNKVHKPITSSGMEDYPDSIVDIDSAGNWKKVNKKTGQVDFVHNSGSKISFYKNGDVVIHTAGNLKQIVENNNDIDPQETKEWLESLSALVHSEGPERAHFLIKQLIDQAYKEGSNIPYTQNTPYINTIPADEEIKSPGDQNIERKIRALIRWNSAVMVVRANMRDPSLGGHIGTFASAATLYDIGMNHFWRAKSNKFG
jgi:hypothetical protein